MEYEIMPYTEADVDAMIEIWNEVVRDGAAFPQLDELNHKTGVEFFGRQSKDLFSREDVVDDKCSYDINYAAFDDIESYRSI